jgi:uncharacterized protein YndB with AHSA1/START domain
MRTITCLHYIAATPDQVWRALTDPAVTRRYYFGLAVESAWHEDAPITFRAPGGAALTGHIVRIEPGHVLMHSLDETSWVTWTLDETQPGLCRVTLCHDDLDPADTEDTWHQVVGGLKTVLETGRALIG